MKHVLVVGSLNMDLVVDVDRLPQTGETILGSRYWNSLGGKGANQSYAAGRAGAEVCMLGSVGRDSHGALLLKKLQEANVQADMIRFDEERPTATAFVLRETSGANSIIVISGANQGCTPEYLEQHENCFKWADCLLCQLEIPLESVYSAVHKAKSLGKFVILNPAPACTNLPDSLFRLVDVITPNETELFLLTGKTICTLAEIVDSAHSLIAKGVKNVVVTLGARGALLVQKDRTIHIPGYIVNCIDTTGAGDCFNGVLASELSAGVALEQAVHIANAAASLSVTRSGALQSMPSKHEIEQWLRMGVEQKEG